MNKPQQKDVYVVGAGFSKGLGYPLTSELLLRLWNRIEHPELKIRLGNVISFHHPRFDCRNYGSFPNVEELLSEMKANEHLYHSSRQYEGKFTENDLKNLQRTILLEISRLFRELSRKVNLRKPVEHWLKAFRDRVKCEEAVIISFNWDLILDELIFGTNPNKKSYGFSKNTFDGPILLKPHGSLNWFARDLHCPIRDDKNILLLGRGKGAKAFECRKLWADNRKDPPLIAPPVHLKQFEEPIFREQWQKCTSVLSTAKKVFFLGYSMPAADYHARFIMRCGFHNQREGELDENNGRKPATGAAEVVIVNPDCESARRIEAIVHPENKCHWYPTRIADKGLRWDLPTLGLCPKML